MQKQMVAYIEKFLSPYLCGYRKGFNAQYALIAMIEKWIDSYIVQLSQWVTLPPGTDTVSYTLK